MKLCVWASHAKRDSGLRGVLPGEASKGTLQEAEPLHCPAQHARARAARVRQELRDLLALPPAKPCEAQDLLALPLQGFCLAPPTRGRPPLGHVEAPSAGAEDFGEAPQQAPKHWGGGPWAPELTTTRRRADLRTC